MKKKERLMARGKKAVKMRRKIVITIFLAYLRLVARIQLFKIKPKVVALTGSQGKTSLRNAVFSVLSLKYRVKKSIKANSETGIPLDLLGLYPVNYSLIEWLKLAFLAPIRLLTNWKKYDVYLVELGVDDPYPPKNMEYLLGFIKPEIAIFLNVSLVHTQQFSKLIPSNKKFSSKKAKEEFLLAKIAREKGKMITFLDENKTAIVNQDDLWVWKMAKETRAKLISFGKNKSQKNGIRIKSASLKPSDLATAFSFEYRKQIFQISLPFLVPDHYASTLAAALAVGLAMKVDLTEACRALEEGFVLPPGRMTFFKGIKSSLLIDSSYNASKKPTLDALELLAKVPAKAKIVVLGDMRELGIMAEQEHRQVAEKILKSADRIVLIGSLTKKHVLPIIEGKKPVKWFENSWQAAKYLKKHLKKNSVVLIKGSQNKIFTEIITQALLKNKKDRKKLCRRGSYWEKQRANLIDL